MPHYLVFQLSGEFVSWGDIAVGEQRPTLPVPTKSAIMGLVAGALGYTRDRDEDHLQLHRDLKLGIQVCNRGGYLTDYHTTQVPSATTVGKKKIESRKQELESGKLETILSSRAYRTSPDYRVALQGDRSLLEKILQALKTPVFTLYIGRKCNVFNLPMLRHDSQIQEADSFEDAILRTPFLPCGRKEASGLPEYWWEEGCSSHLKKLKSVKLRTAPLSRQRWSFSEIVMHMTLNEETSHVS
jgi:CRISPR system Cascade subunit CasD